MMKGTIKIEATDKGVSCRTELHDVGFGDKIHLLAIMFRLLEVKGAEKAAMMCAFAYAANDTNAFDSTEVRAQVPEFSTKEEETEEG